MALVAGVDSSTQSCKIVVRDSETGELVREGRASHPDGTSAPADSWWDALVEAVDDAGGLDDVEAISIGAQQHGMVTLDENGDLVRDALLWNDVRNSDQVDALNDELGADEWVNRVGNTLGESFTVTKLRWLRDEEPENAEKTFAVVLPHDYLTWRLKGGGPGNLNPDDLTTDRSDASGTGYWSAATGEYDMELLELALGKQVHVPKVLGPTEVAGHVADNIPGIPAGIPIGVGGGDNALAGLALGLDTGDAVLSLGTSGTVYAKAAEPVKDHAGIMAGFADATGVHLPLACTLNAARDLDVMAQLLGMSHDELADLALKAPSGADGLSILPYFTGERTPRLPKAQGSMHGMTLDNMTPQHLARATVESMLASQIVMLQAARDAGIPVETLLVIGGAAQSKAIQEILPTLVDLPIFIPTPGEYVADGAAKQAVAALTGSFPDWERKGAALDAGELNPQIMERHLAARQELHGV